MQKKVLAEEEAAADTQPWDKDVSKPLVSGKQQSTAEGEADKSCHLEGRVHRRKQGRPNFLSARNAVELARSLTCGKPRITSPAYHNYFRSCSFLRQFAGPTGERKTKLSPVMRRWMPKYHGLGFGRLAFRLWIPNVDICLVLQDMALVRIVEDLLEVFCHSVLFCCWLTR